MQLSVLDGDEVLFVERLSASGAVISYTQIADRLPVHAASSELILLAHGPTDLQERALARPLRRFTPHTVTDPDRLRAQLARGVCGGICSPTCGATVTPCATASSTPGPDERRRRRPVGDRAQRRAGLLPDPGAAHDGPRHRRDWKLLSGGRRRASMAFLGELSRHGDRVHVRPQDEHGLLDL